ncbi:DUF3298 and DUF4163 domain-containing protein [Spirosoma agri]|uniref:DUF3298 and DUF4163 domain-containing protein n=1 Tax=Spirosoma agri TaxID=1987381 RepID=A0A6M0IN25_9BACT|nr:DUF3298 and DUF4163 domain-containing protein [Spirosoma agri]NEU69302.1 DUF3298 and DUF4163 domain-containing protein [Spirosoma agri]
MKYLLAAFLLSSVSLTVSCTRFKAGPPLLERKQYNLAGASTCDTTINKGVDVSVSYFVLSEESEAARTINDSMQQISAGSIVGWLDSATVANNPDVRTDINKAATLFATDYESMMKDMDKLGGCWELKTTADTVYTGPNAITIKVETFAYTGGAHPNSNLAFYTFDRETGKTLALNDLISDTTALLGVVEKAFRKQQDLRPQYNLEERGYFLRDGRFFLPANVGVGRDGLIFYYNPYEIAAYAVGPIEVTVPYEQLNGIMRGTWY